MARTLEEVQAELAELRAVRASGMQSESVRHSDGRSVATTYSASIDRDIAALEAEERALSGKRRRRTFRLYQSGKGL